MESEIFLVVASDQYAEKEKKKKKIVTQQLAPQFIAEHD